MNRGSDFSGSSRAGTESGSSRPVIAHAVYGGGRRRGGLDRKQSGERERRKKYSRTLSNTVSS